jgi:hypothetical protein
LEKEEMTKLRDVDLRDSNEDYRRWRHSPAMVEFLYAQALKQCPVETDGFSKLNVYCSDRNEVEPLIPKRGVIDVHVKCDLREFRGERGNPFALEQIDKAMQALEAAGHVRKGAHRKVSQEVRRSNFEWTGRVTPWVRRGTSADAFRVMASTAPNGIQLDAEFRFADGDKGRLPLLRSRLSPGHITSRFEAVDWKSAREIELRFYSDAGSHRIQFFGLRSLDSRGMKDLEAEIVKRSSVTFRYSLDRIRPPAVPLKRAKSAKRAKKK